MRIKIPPILGLRRHIYNSHIIIIIIAVYTYRLSNTYPGVGLKSMVIVVQQK